MLAKVVSPAWIALLAAAQASELAGPSPLSVEYSQLSGSSQEIRNAFAESGILVVAGVPGYAAARKDALQAAMVCMTNRSEPPELLEHLRYPDSALCQSAATESQGTLLEPLKLGCPDFESKADVLRALVHMALAHVLHAWESGSSKDVLLWHEREHILTSLSEAVTQARHLDHFHTFGSPGKLAEEAAPSKDLHTDAGLLLAFTAPFHRDGTTFSSSLLTNQGALQLPAESLAFMVGEAAQWLPWPSQPLAHALHLPSNSLRAWYGLTVRLPDDAVKATDFNLAPHHQRTFGEWWGNKSAALASQQELLGCRLGLCDDMTVSCPEGKTLCGMQCRTLPRDCQQTPQCLHKDGSLWSDHLEACPTCTLTCPVFDGRDFCDHSAASGMVMTGFVTYGLRGDSTTPCVVLFFQGWILSTPFKFWLGTLGVFIFSIMLEGVATLQVPEHRAPTLLVTMLYALRMSMGYFVMLAVMTFSVEIFSAVIFGLAVGHCLFRAGPNMLGGVPNSIYAAAMVRLQARCRHRRHVQKFDATNVSPRAYLLMTARS